MSFKLLSVFSQEIINLLNDSDEYNVIIHVGKGENVKTFQAHSLILRARCSYYKTALSKQWAKKEGDSNILSQPNVTPKVFEIILNGTITLNDRDIVEVLEILAAADELLLTDLLDFIQDHLIETKSDWLHSYILKVYQATLSHDSCSNLREFILATISSDPELLFKSPDFLKIDESLILPILKRDDLDMAEDEVWDQVIKWGIAQINPNLRFTNIHDWSSEEFSALASTLSECLPLIRFFQMSGSDLYDKVWPFRAILPPELEDDIVRCHLKVGSKPTFGTNAPRGNSVLIAHQQLSKIADWIDKNDLNITTSIGTDIPYKFKLLIRGSRDGFDSQTFHQRCDNQGPTFVVMKVAASSEIIGGYNPIRWQTGSGHLETRDSFLFSFGNRNRIEDAKISRVSRYNYAITMKDESYGPCFGDKDLWMQGDFSQPDSCSSKEDDYETWITKHRKFSVSEYEVFKIIKK